LNNALPLTIFRNLPDFHPVIHSFIHSKIYMYGWMAVADPGHLVRGRFIYYTFSVATSGNSYEY